MGRALLLSILVLGCGRRGFETDAQPPPGNIDAPEIDAPPLCIDNDNVCLFGCVMMDADCNTTCGDGKCVGNANELCNSCNLDCKTMAAVCGNGACDSGEAAAGCYADCGPALWKWTAEEAMLIDLINTTRTGGKKCPGPGGIVTAPALTVDPALQPHAHEWAWEIAHQNFWTADGQACNGRTYMQRELQGGFTQFITAFGFATVTDAFNDWLSTEGNCNIVMDAGYTSMNVGVAIDLQKGYVFVVK